MRILIRTSKWAIWARRLAGFALPLVVLPVFMHRERLIDSAAFHVVEIAAAAVALLGLLVSIAAFIRLWNSGDRGWDRAVFGFIVSLICLAPFAWATFEASRHPLVLDVSTDAQNPLPLVTAEARPLPSVEALLEVETAFPNVTTRTYPLNAVQMFEIIGQLVLDRGWEIRHRRVPTSVLGLGRINAIATTLLGWRDEVAIRVTGDPTGSTVDMRSVSLAAIHDLGSNGQRIEEFLVALDTEVTLLMRDNPAAVQPLEGVTEEPAEPVEEGAEGGGG
jgi:hypothetical protein